MFFSGRNGGDNLLLQGRRRLPIFHAKKRFLEEVSKHPTVILLAETGSGKTTQVIRLKSKDPFLIPVVELKLYYLDL